jgi:serpin B
MNTEQQLRYERKGSFQVVAIPYAARDLQFVAMIPDKGDGLAGIVAGLTPALLSGCTKMTPRLVALSLPRLELKPPSTNLVEPLRAIGLTKAVSPLLADFSGISKSEPRLFISGVRQSAWLLLDENGTRAAVATDLSAEPFGEAPPPPKPLVLRADRPFLFMIQHVPSGACLLMGCVTDAGATGSAAGK